MNQQLIPLKEVNGCLEGTSEYFEMRLAEGKKFEKYVEEVYFQYLGIDLGIYDDKTLQYEKGECKAGKEIKRDFKFRNTGNLYLEFGEKQPDAKYYMDSGYKRKDNSTDFIIGDEETFWEIPISVILEIETAFYTVYKYTSIGKLMNIEYADMFCTRKFEKGLGFTIDKN